MPNLHLENIIKISRYIASNEDIVYIEEEKNIAQGWSIKPAPSSHPGCQGGDSETTASEYPFN